MKKGKHRRKAHNGAIAHELNELSGEAYHELRGQFPKAALAIKSLGAVSSSLVDQAPGLTSPLFRHRGHR
jgi:hypothetical protein